MKFVGAHLSSGGTLSVVIEKAHKIGAKCFALFTGSQRQWKTAVYEQKTIDGWNKLLEKYQFDPKTRIVPHGSYLANLASPNAEIAEKSRAKLIEELEKCNQLGIGMFNIHPGSTKGEITVEEGIKRIAEGINLAFKESRTGSVKVLLENTAGGGGSIGREFSEIANIIKLIEDKSRIGVCLDTCHLFAAGYDIRTKDKYEETMKSFESTIGFNYLKLMHINDSKADFDSKKDRHENIGKGKIGIDAFKFIMNDPRLNNIPLILETPAKSEVEDNVYEEEIKLLYSLISK